MTDEEVNQIIAALDALNVSNDPGMTLLNAIVQNPTTSSESASGSVVVSNSGNSRSGRPSAQDNVKPSQLGYWVRHGTPTQQRAIRVTGLKLYVYLMDGYNSVTSSLATVLLLDLGGVDGMFKYLLTTC